MKQRDGATHSNDRWPQEPSGHRGEDLVPSTAMSQSNGNEVAWRDWQPSDRAMTKRSQRENWQHSSKNGLHAHCGRHHDINSHNGDFVAHNNFNGSKDGPTCIEFPHRGLPQHSPDSGAVSQQTPHNNLHSFNNNFNAPNSNYHSNHDNPNNFHHPPQTLPSPKRAAKRRMRHDLPGPAGVWFRMHNQKKSRRNPANTHGKNKNSAESHNDTVNNTDSIKAESHHPDETVSASHKSLSSSNSPFHTKSRNQLLFHDYSSDLHDCNAWNYMCFSMERIVPSFHAFTTYLQARDSDATDNGGHHDDAIHKEDNIDNDASIRSYKRLLRSIIPEHQALVHEIHSGKYDVHHLTPELHTNDLRVPLLYGYVSSVACHAHYDWTAVLVDETYACGSNAGERSGGKGAVVCWLEEKLVKRNPNWIRPGVVWMIEGAKLALFASSKEDENEQDGFHANDASGGSVDISPSTEAARGGHAIDRMILVGESSLVYAWTPEEAGLHFTNQDFVKLMEERCDIGLMGGIELGEQKMMNDSKMMEKGSIAECFDLTKDDSHLSSAKSTSDAVELSDGQVVSEGKKDSVSIIPSTDQQMCEKRNHSSIIPDNEVDISKNFSPSDTENERTQHAGLGSCAMDASTANEVNPDLSAIASLTVCEDSRPSQAATSGCHLKPQSCSGVNSCDEATAEQTSSANITKIARQTDHSVDKSSTVTCFVPIVSTTTKQVTQRSSISHNTTQHAAEQSSIRENSTRHKPCNSTRVECRQADDFYEDNNSTHPLHFTHEQPCLVPNQCVLSINKQNNQSSHDQTQERIDSVVLQNSIDKPSESNAIHFPLAGDSFDDSLDIDDDNLFYTMHNSTLVSSEQNLQTCPKALGTTDQQNMEASISHSAAAFPISTATTKLVSSSKTYGFDNIDDDMDSLTEEDDM
ncbi:hypothetical protein HJC23_009633 [Cyclotella cryptica]|uniref:Uncharacterized protein n=1 Tax=Cyclotella cryptica TaxID=29204 RepID=A0ABD3PWX2_9STRA|eukprot:CCRYP_010894-RA/>CCRYP_010894-RA protein AED:0.08 eAED:0.08 QI:0/-1/0/1/-1/1/1/0/918